MKHGRRLQLWMKELLKSKRLNPKNWLYVKNKSNKLTLVHRKSGNIMELEIERRKTGWKAG